MTISRSMGLDPILERLGREGASLLEAEAMREVLADRFNGQSLDSLSEAEWLEALGRMEAVKQTGNAGMK
ncbi:MULTISPECIES: hypothetical protein [unclassified Deinococcus]|uniref:hypothetical protein n=1 Tax=unclassified Deinococcus TaxID=2623546 RepID=UPI0009CA9D5A|nr:MULTISPECIES: hypothetical protein [unclassified Deinococcus]MCD0167434.1 hypothetical protein [Deinococcus sp. 12RED42]OOV15108.1 hypothetical protein BXU09_11060 [Deinococcus sp. LM3]